MLELILFSLCLGTVAGFLAGLFGLGGGVVIVPALVGLFSAYQFPEEQLMIMAIATSLATIIPTSIASIISHQRLGAILWRTAFRLVPLIIIGAGMGAFFAQWIATDLLKWFFIVYLCYVAWRMYLPSAYLQKNIKKNVTGDYWMGQCIGFLSALLGIGGGTLTVPYLINRGLPMKNAVAISSVCGLPIALSGTLSYALLGHKSLNLPEWSLGYVYLPALLGIVSLSVVTAPLGAKLANKLPAQKLKRYFAVIIMCIVFKMISLQA